MNGFVWPPQHQDIFLRAVITHFWPTLCIEKTELIAMQPNDWFQIAFIQDKRIVLMFGVSNAKKHVILLKGKTVQIPLKSKRCLNGKKPVFLRHLFSDAFYGKNGFIYGVVIIIFSKRIFFHGHHQGSRKLWRSKYGKMKL